MATIKTIEIYPFEHSHLRDLRYIILESFGKKMDIDYLRNKYNSESFEINSLSTIAYIGGKPVAFYGAIPQIFVSNTSDKVFVAHACDSYTIPSYQKQGVHYQLALRSYELMQKNNVKLVYAFHSENTFHSTKKLKWKSHTAMKRFHIKASRIPLSKVVNKLNARYITQVVFQKVFGNYIVASCSNPLKEEDKFCQQYSSQFYEYKNKLDQHFILNIENTSFYVKLGAVMHIGYVRFKEASQLLIAIRQLKSMASKIGISELLFQLDPNSKAFQIMKQQFPSYDSWMIGYLPFDPKIDIQEFCFNYADLDTF